MDDEFFLHRTRAYLQCLILAYNIRPEFIHETMPAAAKELFDVVKNNANLDHFPSVLRFLRTVGEKHM